MRMPGRIGAMCVNACLAGCLAINNQHGPAMTAHSDPGRITVRAREEGIGSR